MIELSHASLIMKVEGPNNQSDNAKISSLNNVDVMYSVISVLDLVMIAPIQLQCIFPIPFWPILKWKHMYLR